MIYLRLFLEFFKAGLFAVGGGLATSVPVKYGNFHRMVYSQSVS